jgi:hypothetical protein
MSTLPDPCKRCNELELNCNGEDNCTHCADNKVTCEYENDTMYALQLQPTKMKLISRSAVQTPASSRTRLNQDIQPSDDLVVDSQPNDGTHANELQSNNEAAILMSAMPREDYIPLIDRVHYEESQRNHALITKTPLSNFRAECMSILASMYDKVLAGLLDGNLAEQYA